MKSSFEKRPHGIPISTIGRQTPGVPQRKTVIAGDTVTLKIGQEIILIHKTEVLGDGKYSGEIHGFEPSCSVDYQGHFLEDIVEFEEANVFVLQIP
jgi:hypothetical protein